MADLPISSAATLTSATLATGDLIPILDISAGAGSKGSKITAAEHKKYLGKDMDANVAYVRTGATGGTVGNPADPYGNITAAYAGIDTTTASAGPWLFDLDTGAHILTLVTAAVTTTNELFFRGAGPTTVVTITVAGADGDPATSSYGESITFGDGSDPFVFASDHSCSIAFNVTAGDGGSGLVPDGGGGSGGSVGGRLHIKNAIVDTATFSFGVGAFGDGLESGNQGPDGTVLFDDLSTINCEVTDVTSPTIITSALDSVVNGAFNVGAPAGSGSELQFRSSGTAFGAVTGTSVSGGTITGGAHVGLTDLGVSMANNTAMTGFALGTINDTTSRPFSITQTWNNAGLTAQGLVVNITNTASATASRLFDVQLGGTSKVSVDTNGALVAGGRFGVGAPTLYLSPVANGIGFIVSGANGMEFTASGAAVIAAAINGGNGPTFQIAPNTTLGFGSSGTNISNAGTLLVRGGADATLQMGVNTAVNSATATAQTFKAPNATGTTSTGGSMTITGGTGTSVGGAVILATSASTGAPTASITCAADGSVIFGKLPSSAVTLADGQVTVEFTDATTLTFRGRNGGTTRTATLTLA